MTAREWFDAAAGRYETLSSTGLVGLLRRRERTAVFRLLDPSPGSTVLDAGCGSGFYAVPLAARGCEVVGVDASPEMVRVARTRGVDAHVGDLTDLSLGRRFDVVLCAGALEFCADPAGVLARLALHVGPGGSLVLLLPLATAMGRLYRAYHRRHGVAVRLFARGEVDEILAGLGLAVTAFERTTPLTAALRAVGHKMERP